MIIKEVHVNGTQYIIEDFQQHCIKPRKLNRSRRYNETDIIFIPKNPNTTSDCDFPALFKRIQFPILGAYYITINQAQGQSLKIAGLYLTKSVFTHGQLFVAFSRFVDPDHFFIFADQSEFDNLRHLLDPEKKYKRNIVFREIFS